MANIKEIEARREARAKKEKLEREARDARDLEALDELEEKHGGANLMQIPMQTPLNLPGMAIIRRPDGAEYRNWIAVTRKGSKGEQHEASRRLGLDCLLYPDVGVWEAVVEACPGISDTIGFAAVKFSGGVLEQKND
jgi:hypothetical protein